MVSQCFPAQCRLLQAAEYDAVFKRGQRIALRAGTYLIKPTELPHCRLGLVIAKKNLRQAVRRNYVKRIMRELFRCHQSPLPAHDIVFIAGKNLAKLNREQLYQCCKSDWQKLITRWSA